MQLLKRVIFLLGGKNLDLIGYPKALEQEKEQWANYYNKNFNGSISQQVHYLEDL